ncbi:MAG: hypothetical protein ACKOD3_06645 [Phenylobacterium sp.]
MTSRSAAISRVLVSVFVTLAAAGCSPQPPPRDAVSGRQDEAAYLSPPAVDLVSSPAGSLELTGRATPGARVQLARPGGGGLSTQADPGGRWRIRAHSSAAPLIFGLSQTSQGRTIQADGYVFHSPVVGGWVLRAGAASRPLGGAPPQALVVDSDRSGGTVVSGQGPRDTLLVAQIDGRRAGEGGTGPSGRYEIRLKGPVPMGESRLRIFGAGLNRETVLRLSPPKAPVDGPFRVLPQAAGLRVDWITPGGGLQSTQILY